MGEITDIGRLFDQLEDGGTVPEGEHPEFFGSYQLIEPIGAGGTARVYRARHVHPKYSEHAFAVKILHERLLENSPIRTLFRNEGYFLSLLKHPNIVQTHEAGIEGNNPFVAMEYVDGVDLSTTLERFEEAGRGPPLALLLHILREVLRGLAFAHRVTDSYGEPIRLVHRDINPSNVFLSYDGAVKIGDFGVAVQAGRAIPPELSAGTPGHFAPEQMETEPLDQSADVFACGILMYGMLLGVFPFDGQDREDTILRNQRGRFTRPSRINPAIDPKLEAIIERALQRSPDDRYPDAAAMLAALDNCTPTIAGMDLVVRSTLRGLFFDEYSRALEMRVGLSGGSGGLRDSRVVICGSAPQVGRALARGLRERGFSAAFGNEAASSSAGAVILDLRTTTPSSQQLHRWTRGPSGRLLPVVALAHRVDPDSVALANHVLANDLVLDPVEPDRLYAALWSTLLLRGDATSSAGSTVTSSHTRARILVVSRDAQRARYLADGLHEYGYSVVLVSSTNEAIAHLTRASVRLAIYEMSAEAADGTEFAARLRETPGMGMVPILFLCASGTEQRVAGLKRTLAQSQGADVETVAACLEALNGDFRFGRAYQRYRVSLPAELTFGGRTYGATATELSRGGGMFRCMGIPPIGVDATMCLHFDREEVHMRGRILRVDPTDSDEAAVSFCIASIGAQMEAELVRQITALAESSATHTIGVSSRQSATDSRHPKA